MKPDEIITCRICKKRYLRSKGFYKGYRICKGCKLERELKRLHEGKDYFATHLFTEEDDNMRSICKRCGIIRIRKAKAQKGRWRIEYYKNGEVTDGICRK